MKLKISEEIERNSLDESLGGRFKYEIDDIDSATHHSTLKPLPIAHGEKRIWISRLQNKCLYPDRAALREESFNKWTEEREEQIRVKEDVQELLGKVFEVHERFESLGYPHGEIFPCRRKSQRNKASKRIG
jgi:hypothetical protein